MDQPGAQAGHAPPGAAADNYHGYATQDFLAVDPRFGDAEDLRGLVADAHATGLRVILDVVLNHAGDVFAYDRTIFDARWDGREYPVDGWRTPDGLVPFTPEAAAAAWPDGAVHPAELHPPESFTRRGRIVDWDRHPEYVEGDFEGLKDIAHGSGPLDDFRPSPALAALTRAYCWWLGYADLDGFRVDTVKHMEPGATRYFASVVHEFAQSVGKDRFLLVGEIAGPREEAIATMELTGLDAALGLAEVQSRLVGAATGAEDPAGYFALFRNSELIGKDSHTWLRDTVVTNVDDHDLVRQGPVKSRLCATFEGRELALGVLALNVLTLGIPCLYYGTEQRLDGSGGPPVADRYVREAMFGGGFGAFRSRDRHVFDETRRCTRRRRRCSRCAARSRRCGGGGSTCARSPKTARRSGADRVRRAGAQRGGVVADPRPARGAVRDQHGPGAGADGMGDRGRRAARGGGVAGAAVRQRRGVGRGGGAQRLRRADHPAAGGGGGVRVTPSGAAGMIRRSRSAASPSTRSASW